MPILFLTSTFYYCDKSFSQDGEKIYTPHVIPNFNSFVDNLSKYLKSENRAVLITTEPDDFENNDFKANIMKQSFEMTGMKFDEFTALDNRNKRQAKQILHDASIVILSGGRLLTQNKFIKDIKLSERVNTEAVLIGSSAGSMNMGKIAFNFIEDELGKNERRFVSGIGLFGDLILVPHFDGTNQVYQIQEFCEIDDIYNKQILPYSTGKTFIGLPDMSYIVVDKNKRKTLYGTAYRIQNEKIIQMDKI